MKTIIKYLISTILVISIQARTQAQQMNIGLSVLSGIGINYNKMTDLDSYAFLQQGLFIQYPERLENFNFSTELTTHVSEVDHNIVVPFSFQYVYGNRFKYSFVAGVDPFIRLNLVYPQHKFDYGFHARTGFDWTTDDNTSFIVDVGFNTFRLTGVFYEGNTHIYKPSNNLYFSLRFCFKWCGDKKNKDE